MVTFTSDMTVELVNSTGSDEMLARAALVSTMSEISLEEIPTEKMEGLIPWLLANRHGSPFEHAQMTFFIEAPIFVFREFHRHRAGWSYNETSGRYKVLEPKFYVPDETRPLTQIGKPGAYEFVPGTRGQQVMLNSHLRHGSERSYEAYEFLLEAGIAKEVARMTLPVNICSSMYATCNPRSLMHFLGLRTKDERATTPSYPMHEIEMVARKMEAHFAEAFPITYAAFNSAGRVSP